MTFEAYLTSQGVTLGELNDRLRLLGHGYVIPQAIIQENKDTIVGVIASILRQECLADRKLRGSRSSLTQVNIQKIAAIIGYSYEQIEREAYATPVNRDTPFSATQKTLNIPQIQSGANVFLTYERIGGNDGAFIAGGNNPTFRRHGWGMVKGEKMATGLYNQDRFLANAEEDIIQGLNANNFLRFDAQGNIDVVETRKVIAAAPPAVLQQVEKLIHDKILSNLAVESIGEKLSNALIQRRFDSILGNLSMDKEQLGAISQALAPLISNIFFSKTTGTLEERLKQVEQFILLPNPTVGPMYTSVFSDTIREAYAAGRVVARDAQGMKVKVEDEKGRIHDLILWDGRGKRLAPADIDAITSKILKGMSIALTTTDPQQRFMGVLTDVDHQLQTHSLNPSVSFNKSTDTEDPSLFTYSIDQKNGRDVTERTFTAVSLHSANLVNGMQEKIDEVRELIGNQDDKVAQAKIDALEAATDKAAHGVVRMVTMSPNPSKYFNYLLKKWITAQVEKIPFVPKQNPVLKKRIQMIKALSSVKGTEALVHGMVHEYAVDMAAKALGKSFVFKSLYGFWDSKLDALGSKHRALRSLRKDRRRRRRSGVSTVIHLVADMAGAAAMDWVWAHVREVALVKRALGAIDFSKYMDPTSKIGKVFETFNKVKDTVRFVKDAGKLALSESIHGFGPGFIVGLATGNPLLGVIVGGTGIITQALYKYAVGDLTNEVSLRKLLVDFGNPSAIVDNYLRQNITAGNFYVGNIFYEFDKASHLIKATDTITGATRVLSLKGVSGTILKGLDLLGSQKVLAGLRAVRGAVWGLTAGGLVAGPIGAIAGMAFGGFAGWSAEMVRLEVLTKPTSFIASHFYQVKDFLASERMTKIIGYGKDAGVGGLVLGTALVLGANLPVAIGLGLITGLGSWVLRKAGLFTKFAGALGKVMPAVNLFYGLEALHQFYETIAAGHIVSLTSLISSSTAFFLLFSAFRVALPLIVNIAVKGLIALGLVATGVVVSIPAAIVAAVTAGFIGLDLLIRHFTGHYIEGWGWEGIKHLWNSGFFYGIRNWFVQHNPFTWLWNHTPFAHAALLTAAFGVLLSLVFGFMEYMKSKDFAEAGGKIALSTIMLVLTGTLLAAGIVVPSAAVAKDTNPNGVTTGINCPPGTFLGTDGKCVPISGGGGGGGGGGIPPGSGSGPAYAYAVALFNQYNTGGSFDPADIEPYDEVQGELVIPKTNLCPYSVGSGGSITYYPNCAPDVWCVDFVERAVGATPATAFGFYNAGEGTKNGFGYTYHYYYGNPSVLQAGDLLDWGTNVHADVLVDIRSGSAPNTALLTTVDGGWLDSQKRDVLASFPTPLGSNSVGNLNGTNQYKLQGYWQYTGQ